MILGMTTFTFAHVALSLMGILAGFVVLVGLLRGDRMDGWTHIFLATTVATTLTGFLFPSNGFTPAIGVGIVSTLVLLATLAGRYRYRLAGPWRLVYVVGAMAALYLNTFVLVVQAFLKVPAFHALAPGGNEPPFAIAQGIVLVFFVVTGYLSVKRFHPAAA